MLIFKRPFASAKCGISHEIGLIASGVASGRMNRLPPVVSNSTIFVTVTSPIFHFMLHPVCSVRLRFAREGKPRLAKLK